MIEQTSGNATTPTDAARLQDTIRVLVAEGDTVAEGQVICLLEAMKMENELKAPKAGVVKAMHAQPGQDVEMGAVLAEIE